MENIIDFRTCLVFISITLLCLSVPSVSIQNNLLKFQSLNPQDHLNMPKQPWRLRKTRIAATVPAISLFIIFIWEIRILNKFASSRCVLEVIARRFGVIMDAGAVAARRDKNNMWDRLKMPPFVVPYQRNSHGTKWEPDNFLLFHALFEF